MWVRLMTTALMLPVTTGTARLRFARPPVAHAYTGHGPVPRRVGHTHTSSSHRRGVATRARYDEGGDAEILASFDLAGVAQRIADGKATRIVTMVRPPLPTQTLSGAWRWRGSRRS
jgi:hypothetical protein